MPWRSASARSSSSGRSSVTSSPAASDTEPSTVIRRHGAARSSSRPRNVTVVEPVTASAAPATSVLDDVHHVEVVRVGLVQLEHRELGVVAAVDPLVAEVPADLVDALEAADQQALQVQLQRDPQVQVDVQHVVVGDERLRHRAAGDRLQHRGLDLDEAALVQVRADRPQRRRARAST